MLYQKYFPYTTDDQYYLYDADTSIVYSTTERVHKVVSLLNSGLSEQEVKQYPLADDSDNQEIEECLSALTQLAASSTVASDPKRNLVRKHKKVRSSDWFSGQALNKLWLSLTDGCNMKCAYCFGKYGHRSKQMMTEQTAKACIDYFFEYAARQADQYNVNFFGGEPLLNKEVFIYAVNYINCKAREIGKSIHYIITTNGTILDDEILELLIANNMYINISIDGAEGIHNLNRKFGNGRGSFAKIIENIRRIQERGYHNLIARITLTKPGVKSLQADVEFLWQFGFNHIFIDPVKSDLPELALDIASLHELREQLDNLLEMMKVEQHQGNSKIIRSITDSYEAIDNRSLKAECMYFNPFTLQFTPGGEVYKCSFTEQHKQERAGNVDEGIEWEAFYREYVPEQRCLNCWAKRLCGGGCYLDKDNSIMCEYSKLMTEYALRYYSFLKNYKLELKED